MISILRRSRCSWARVNNATVLSKNFRLFECSFVASARISAHSAFVVRTKCARVCVCKAEVGISRFVSAIIDSLALYFTTTLTHSWALSLLEGSADFRNSNRRFLTTAAHECSLIVTLIKCRMACCSLQPRSPLLSLALLFCYQLSLPFCEQFGDHAPCCVGNLAAPPSSHFSHGPYHYYLFSSLLSTRVAFPLVTESIVPLLRLSSRESRPLRVSMIARILYLCLFSHQSSSSQSRPSYN